MKIDHTTELNISDFSDLALEAGFTYAAPLAMDALVFRPEVRSMCAADRCRSYGKSWSCPPAAGTLEYAAEKAGRYSRGIIVQTVGDLKDDFDMEAIRSIADKHASCFDTLVRQVRMLRPDCLPMGAGTCRRCRRCTYPDRPCRHPDRLWPSMEAYGLLVSDVCTRSGLSYNYGSGTMSFTSCILID